MSTILHGHHANETKCPLSFDMNTEARIHEIETIKPENERPLRLLLLREVDPTELPTKWQEAYAEWQEARAEWEAAYAKYQEAYAKWEEAYAKYQEAGAKLQEVYAKWEAAYAERQKAKRQKAYAKRRKADAKLQEAGAKWQKTDAKIDWDTWHKEHCGGVKAGVCKWTVEHPSIF